MLADFSFLMRERELDGTPLEAERFGYGEATHYSHWKDALSEHRSSAIVRAWIRRRRSSRDRLSPSATPEGIETVGGIHAPELHLKDLSGLEIHDLWREAEADSVGLGKMNWRRCC